MVISTKAYVDSNTSKSKGFSFILYYSVVSVKNAINKINGFDIGSKRLKVKHNRVHPKHSSAVGGGGASVEGGRGVGGT